MQRHLSNMLVPGPENDEHPQLVPQIARGVRKLKGVHLRP